MQVPNPGLVLLSQLQLLLVASAQSGLVAELCVIVDEEVGAEHDLPGGSARRQLVKVEHCQVVESLQGLWKLMHQVVPVI